MVLMTGIGYAQSVHIFITSLPDQTPAGAALFLASNCNEWDASNTNYRLRKLPDGRYYINLEKKANDTLFFKFTRGSWSAVEGDGLGKRRNNRFHAFVGKNDTLQLKIDSWEDIKPEGVFRLVVVDATGTTPNGADIFFTGNINNWEPGNSHFKLKPLLKNTYAIDIPVYGDTIRYKYTRGSWSGVEGDRKGGIRNERTIVPDSYSEAYDTISTWEDIAYPRHYHLWVDELPGNTPKAADIYVTGNFNNWDPGDTNHIMTKTDSGFFINISYPGDTLNYKYTRGDWQTVEGRTNGLAIPNRAILFDHQKEVVKDKIYSWEDLKAGGFQLYTLTLIIPVVMGLLLIFALHGVRSLQPSTPILQVLIGLVCLALLFRLVLYYRDIFNWYPQLIVFSDFIYFLYAPIFLLYVRQVLSSEVRPGLISHVLFLTPIALMLIFYIQFFIVDYEDFIFNIVNNDFKYIFATSGAFGFGFNLFCWSLGVWLYRKAPVTNKAPFVRLAYVKTLLIYQGLILVFWFMVYVIGGVAELMALELAAVVNICVDISWFLFAGNIYLYTFLLIRDPEIFKTNEEVTTVKHNLTATQPELENLIRQVEQLMEKEKPYLNEGLSLQELADLLEINIHQLSRVINEGFDMNFFDYINTYRIEEFIAKVSDPVNDHKTYLSLAYEAGFNSKSTFNRAFKKVKNQSPREFFKSRKAVA
ncbi:hypothetical protein C900_01247 [Fulvivirga imtechensis AK7]|uniref:HTH araC/xylS-type domain-containing protein n=2 Tax=Fulvivirga TaxID=396811 RepID=L8JWJ6_9BACT|nr:hypothetical protein C900_01247 [Fulvivirga imtechensis AK7]